jgi:hypothetical protein
MQCSALWFISAIEKYHNPSSADHVYVSSAPWRNLHERRDEDGR